MALSQKLRSDVQAMASAMNLTDEQKEALNTLFIGNAVVRLADEHPEPFLVRIPLSPVKEGSISDTTVRERMARYHTDSNVNGFIASSSGAVSAIPPSDGNTEINDKNKMNINTHPPSPKKSQNMSVLSKSEVVLDSKSKPHDRKMNREETRFLADVAARPLSTTVSRYQRLHLSRRRGNAIRQHLAASGIIEAVTIATRSGQVVLYQLTEAGRSLCRAAGIKLSPRPRESIEHSFWVHRAAKHFETKGYSVSREHPVRGNGAIDLLAEKGAKRIAIEVETGKSNIKTNLNKIRNADFDRIFLVATCPTAVAACQKAVDATERDPSQQIEQLTWFDIS